MNDMVFSIRNSHKNDACDILKIYNDSNSIYENYRDQSILETFEKMIKDESLYILEENDVPIGFGSYKGKIEHALISSLYIMKIRQKQGFGKKLLEYLEQEIEKENYKAIVLKALKQHKNSIEFYSKCGYININEEISTNFIKEYFPLKQWDYLMIKVIN